MWLVLLLLLYELWIQECVRVLWVVLLYQVVLVELRLLRVVQRQLESFGVGSGASTTCR